MVSRDRGHYYFAPPDRIEQDLIVLPDDEYHHLLHVMRTRAGQQVAVTDGAGCVYLCEVTSEGPLRILERKHEYGEARCRITVIVGILKGDANRDVLDIAVQLGAAEVMFCRMEHSEGRLSPHRVERLRRAAISAVKQCGRARLPVIRAAESLESSLSGIDDSARILAAQQAEPERLLTGVTSDCASDSGWVLVIGPEGGLSAAEQEMLLNRGAQRLTLADRRLRTPVAVAAALCFILQHAGESGILK